MNKILFLSQLAPIETNNSASENYVLECIKALQRKKHEVFVTDFNQYQRLTKLENNVCTYSGLIKNSSSLALIMNTCWFLIREGTSKDKINIVSHNISRKHLPIYICARVLGMKITFWILDFYPVKKSFYKTCVSLFAKKVVCINKNIQTVLSPICKTEIFYGGYNDKVYNLIKPEESRTPYKIVFAGTLSKLNCVDLIIEFAINTKYNIHLDIFGSGELQSMVYASTLTNKNIIFHGLVDRNIVIKHLHKAHYLLLPRKIDDNYYKWFFPSKAIEMLSMPGLTICQEMKGVTDILKESTITTNLFTWQDIERSIENSFQLSDDNINSKNSKKHNLFSNEFNWDHLPSKLLDK